MYVVVVISVGGVGVALCVSASYICKAREREAFHQQLAAVVCVTEFVIL